MQQWILGIMEAGITEQVLDNSIGHPLHSAPILKNVCNMHKLRITANIEGQNRQLL